MRFATSVIGEEELGRRAPGAVVRFVLASVVLVGGVAGLPVALVALARFRFGGPAPWSGFDPTPWVQGAVPLDGAPADGTVVDLAVRFALVVGWGAFASLVVSFPAEIRHRRRHAGIGLPRSGPLLPVRAVVAWTVTGLTALAGSPVSAVDVTDVLRADATASVFDASLDLDGTSARSDGPVPIAASTTADTTIRYTVRSGDSVLSIAETVLGDAASTGSVHRLADAIVAVNAGRTMPDGRVFDSPALIEPGWILEVPGRAATSSFAHSAHTVHTVHTVQPGDTLWSLAHTYLGDGHRWSEVWEHNADRTMVDGRRFDDPDLIRVGWTLEIVDEASPSEPGSDPATRTEPEPDTGPSAVAAIPEPPAHEHVAGPEHVAAAEPTVPTELVEPVAPVESGPVESAVVDRPASIRPIATLGVMAAGASLALVAAQRRRRLRSAPVLGRIPSPGSVHEPVERELRLLGRDERPVRVDLATRCAARSLDEADARILVVVAAPDSSVLVVTDGDVSLPAPWTGAGREWTLPGDVAIDRLAALSEGSPMPCPTLVEIGTDERGALVALDLAAVGSLDVDGADRLEVDGVLRALATGLAASAFARDVALVTVGLDGVAGPDGRVWTLDAGSDVGAALARLHGADPAEDLHETEDLVVVFDPAAPDHQVRVVGPERADGRVGPDASAVLRRGAAGWEVSIDRAAPGAGAWCAAITPVGIDPEQGAALAELVAWSDRRVDPAPDRALDQHLDRDAAPDAELDARAGRPHAMADAPDWHILVRVLGPVDVVDRDLRPIAFRRGKSRELVVWLATHRNRSTRDGARTALWETDVRHGTMSNVVSEARRALAVAADPGPGHWLERGDGDRLELHEAVATDLDLVLDAVSLARGLPAPQVIEIVGPLLAMIRGVPFHGTGYAWTDAEGITSRAVVAATSAATVVAEAHLELGDLDGVFDATATGLAALPGHEGLIGLRLRAHAARGDRSAIREEWCAYERSLASDPWFDGEPAPSLLELRRELLVTTAA